MATSTSTQPRTEDNQAEAAKAVVAQYTRPTPAHFTADGQEYHLYQDESYTLPDCPFVQSLLQQGFLKEIN